MMARERHLILAALVLALTGCARTLPVRPLTCPIVECRSAHCQTPPVGMPYMSDRWRCALNAPIRGRPLGL